MRRNVVAGDSKNRDGRPAPSVSVRLEDVQLAFGPAEARNRGESPGNLCSVSRGMRCGAAVNAGGQVRRGCGVVIGIARVDGLRCWVDVRSEVRDGGAVIEVASVFHPSARWVDMVSELCYT